MTDQNKLDQLCINTIRTLSMDAIQKANSGHPGAPMGLATVAYVLWAKHLKHNPKNPNWFNRDRFVLSGGHASMLLYSLLYLSGYGLKLDDIKNFRQMDSKTPGHPEFGHTTGVETTTGPLGQGIANAVGMAIGEAHLAAKFNREEKIIDHHTFVIAGDGDLMEGIAQETISLAGHLELSKLICLYDSNRITIEGSTDISFSEDVKKKFEAANWHVLEINGNNIDEIDSAIISAKKSNKPTLIICETNIAFGSPNKQDSSGAHGAPLGEEEIKLTKKNLGWDYKKDFFVPEEVLSHFEDIAEKAKGEEEKWNQLFETYQKNNKDMAEEFLMAKEDKTPETWESDIPPFETSLNMATRAASGKVLNAITKKIKNIIGGSADLAPSNKSYIETSSDFQKDNYAGQNIRFGVREHAMGAITSGIILHKGLKAFCATFFVFSDYMKPAIRIAALMRIPTIYIFTHDSVAVGEDGPTHQPIEHLASLRSIPNLITIRPADANETLEAWSFAITNKQDPVAIILSRQKLPIFKKGSNLKRGAYIFDESKKKEIDLIIIATGSELHICLEAKKELEKESFGIRLVAMPSWELFEKQSKEYKEEVLPKNIKKRLVVEAASTFGWQKYATDEGKIIGIDSFGQSAPGSELLKKLGFNVQNIKNEADKLLST